jgi:hypothetical protein
VGLKADVVLPRCEHGVYANPGDPIVQEWSFTDPDTGEFVGWCSYYCSICVAKYFLDAEERRIQSVVGVF